MEFDRNDLFTEFYIVLKLQEDYNYTNDNIDKILSIILSIKQIVEKYYKNIRLKFVCCFKNEITNNQNSIYKDIIQYISINSRMSSEEIVTSIKTIPTKDLLSLLIFMLLVIHF